MIEAALLKKAAPWILVLGTVIGSLYWTYSSGKEDGAANVQVKWDAEKASHKKAIDTLKDQYATLESKVRLDNQRNSDELGEQEKAHAVAIVELEREYTSRLQQSDKRTSYYERLAKGGAIEQADLASYAARLDRSLEDGRRVVGQLTETLRQRDNQLRAIAKQLENDRSLLTMGNQK